MSGIVQAAPTIAMLACFALVVGGVAMVRAGQNRRKGVLMLVMAAVLLGNVLIWTV